MKLSFIWAYYHSLIANHRDSSNLVIIFFTCDSPLMSYFTRKIFFLMRCYLVEFLFSLIRSGNAAVQAMQNTKASRHIAESSFVNSIEIFIEANLTKAPSLPFLCGHFSLSRTYLCRIFKEGTGTSPIDYWIDLKMKEAKKLIREGNYNITQISEYLGYSSIHHFTRMFKRHTGLSPNAYKSSVKI